MYVYIVCLYCLVDDKCKMADVVFLLDSSSSINKRQGWRDGWRRILEFANYVVGRLDVGRNRVRVSYKQCSCISLVYILICYS